MAEQEKKMSVALMREIVKAQGVRNTSVMSKAELQMFMRSGWGFWKINQKMGRTDKEQPTQHQLRKGRNMR